MTNDGAIEKRDIKKELKQFIFKTLNAMTYGIFATIVVGTIIAQLGSLIHVEVLTTLVNSRLSMLLGVGIGISIAMALKLDGLKFICLAIAGGIATAFTVDFNMSGWYDPSRLNNNPITVYFVVILSYLAISLIFKKKTPFDLFFIPIVTTLVAVLSVFIVSWPIDRLMDFIYFTIKQSMTAQPYITTAIVALIFGILLTLPFISSAGIAIAVFTQPFNQGDQIAIVAMCAAVIGCSVQMVGFTAQSRKNEVGTIFTILFASSMFQFKNIVKKPIIWVPTLIATLILGPLSYFIFDGYSFMIQAIDPINSHSAAWAGMGSSGLVGQLQTLAFGKYSLSSFMFVLFQTVVPFVLVLALDMLFTKTKIYSQQDLLLDASI